MATGVGNTQCNASGTAIDVQKGKAAPSSIEVQKEDGQYKGREGSYRQRHHERARVKTIDPLKLITMMANALPQYKEIQFVPWSGISRGHRREGDYDSRRRKGRHCNLLDTFDKPLNMLK